ncbi:MAG: hypothetical protein JWP63_5873 [Candidatus Solibacter sp.]|jgi:uncharacterized protein (TIGR03435 family)|nr:hypothetical protein [Candidatus Solibacter sp.]
MAGYFRIVKDMRPTHLLLIALAVSAAFGQTPAPRPEFEVASVKPSTTPPSGAVNVGLKINGAQLHISSLALRDYIRIAYRVKEYQVSGPDWITAERYEIDAKLPAGATRDQVPEMLQSLLTDRFALKLHRGSKDLPIYALIVASGGLKMKELPVDPEDAAAAGAPIDVAVSGSAAGVNMNFGRGATLAFGNNKFEAHKLTMFSLADSLGRWVDRPVIDMTGLTGKYDFTLDLTPEDYRALLIRSAVAAGVTLPPEALRLLDGATDDSLHNALRAVGLKLDPRKAPLEVLLIDHVNKTPTEN